jgi:hypothetical protein
LALLGEKGKFLNNPYGIKLKIVKVDKLEIKHLRVQRGGAFCLYFGYKETL